MDTTYWEDIFSQPDSLEKVAIELKCKEMELRDLGSTDYRKIIFTGMGSSNYCSFSACQYLNEHGKETMHISTSELLYFGMDQLDDKTLIVVISQSGESAEIVHLFEVMPKSMKVIGITNDSESTLAKHSDIVLVMNVEEEKSVTTRTYVAGIAIALYVSIIICGGSYSQFLKGLLEVIENMRSLLNEHDRWLKAISQFVKPGSSVWVIGRGMDFMTVKAGALFLREVARVDSIPEIGGEFRHGPFEVVDEQFSAVVISTEEAVHKINQNLIQDIQEKGGRVFVISDQEETNLSLPQCNKWFKQIQNIIPLQFLADFIAKEKGIVAGEFRWGSKITKKE